MSTEFQVGAAFVSLGVRGSVAAELATASTLAANLNKELAKGPQAAFADLAIRKQQAQLAQTRLNIAQAQAQLDTTGSATQVRGLLAQMALQEKSAQLRAKQEQVLAGLIGKDDHRKAVAAALTAESEKTLNNLRQQLVTSQEQAKINATPAGQRVQQQTASTSVLAGMAQDTAARQQELLMLRERARLLATPAARAQTFASLVTQARGDEAGANVRKSQSEMAGQFAGSAPGRAAASANVGADMAGLLAQRKQELVLLQERAKFLASSEGTKAIQQQITLVKEAATAQKSIDWNTKVAELGKFGAAVSVARDKVSQLASALGGVATVAGVLGGVSFAGMIKFAEIASPAQAMLFNYAMRDLSGTIGQIFIPVLEKATAAVRGLADWFINLTPKTKAMFAAVAVGAAAGVAAFGMFTAAVGVASAAMLAFNATTGGILLGIGVVVTGAVAAFAGLAAMVAMNDSAFKSFGNAASAVGDLVRSVAAIGGAAFATLTPAIELVAGVISGLAEVLKPVALAFKELAVSVMSAFGGEGGKMVFEFGKKLATVAFGMTIIGPLVTSFVTVVAGGFALVVSAAEKVVAVFGVIGKALVNAMTFNPKKMAEAFAAIPGEMNRAFAEIDKKREKARKELEGDRSSVGAGAGGTPIIAGIAEAKQTFQERALMQFAGQGGRANDPAERTASAAERQETLLQRLIEAVRERLGLGR